MNKLRLLKLSILFIVIIFTSCKKVSTLSDHASIESVSIISTLPDKLIFDTPILGSKVIELPLNYGKYLFPIKVSFDIKCNAECMQLLGLEDANTLSFDNINHIREIYVVAQSGATTKWQVKIKDNSSGESSDILKVLINSYQAQKPNILGEIAQISRFDTCVFIPVIGEELLFPIKIKPSITVAENAKIIAGSTDEMEFKTQTDIKNVSVESSSGKVKIWKFKLLKVTSKSNLFASELTLDQVIRLTPKAESVKIEDANIVKDTCLAIFNKSGRGVLDCVLKTRTGVIEFPLRIKINIPVDNNSVAISLPSDNIFTFSSYSDSKVFYVQDKVSGLIKYWTLCIYPPNNTDIKQLAITSFTCDDSSISVDTKNVVVDNSKSTIVVALKRQSGVAIAESDKLNLKLNFNIKLFEGSSASETSFKHTYITNTNLLNIVSASGLESRTWLVMLKDDNAALSSDKRLANMFISKYSSKNNKMVLERTNIVADNDKKSIVVGIKDGGSSFPLVLDKKSFKFYSPSTYIVESAVADYDSDIVFNSLLDIKEFTVKAADGSSEKWKIVLNNLEAEKGKTTQITGFSIAKISAGSNPSEITINNDKKAIEIFVDGDLPIYISPIFTTSDNATVEGLDNNLLVFDSYSQVNSVKVVSEDRSVTQIWSISIKSPAKVQIANSSFDSWGTYKDVNSGTFTIDPTPGLGFGWGTANLKLLGMGVQGAMPIDRNGGKAAELVTSEQNTIFKGFVVAAGTLYTGVFNMNLDYITQPRKMTNFGIPYTARPKSVSLELKYEAGKQLKQAEVNSLGKYYIKDINGVDKGQVLVQLVKWKGSGSIVYDGNTSPNIDVIAEYELVIDGANNPYKNWSTVTLPLAYSSKFDGQNPSHIVVIMSSSKEGDKFIGAYGSKLSVDNFVINY